MRNATIMAGGRAERIRLALDKALAPAALDVRDDSASHAGHAGNPDGAGQTHYSVRAVAACFAGQNRLARQRMVHAALADEFATGLHALSLRLETPEEAKR